MKQPRITSEIILFVTSFFIALAVWLVAKQNDFEMQTVAAVVKTSGSPDYMTVSVIPPKVNVSLQYPKSYSYLITPDAIFIEIKGIDENSAGLDMPKQTRVNINLHNVNMGQLPEAVRPLVLGQDIVNVNAQLRAEKARIRVQKIGEPHPDFRLLDDVLQANPAEVSLIGLPGSVSTVKKEKDGFIELLTEPVHVEGKVASFFENVTVPLPDGLFYVRDENSRIEKLDKLTAQVHVVIGEKELKKTFPDVPIVIKTFYKNLKAEYSPTKASITVEGPKSMLDQMNADAFIIIPRQTLEETPNYSGDIAIDAKWSEKIPPAIKDKVSITSWQPEVISLKFIPIEEPKPGGEKPSSVNPTATPIRGGIKP